MLRSGLKQAFRMPGRIIAYFLVTALVCAFLCIGMNLKQIADRNLQTILDSFDVVALPDFKAYITEDARLSADPFHQESIGYLQCEAINYDVKSLLELPGVRSIDARNRFGACIDSATPGWYTRMMNTQSSLQYEQADVVIFKLRSSEPYHVTGWQKTDTGLRAKNQTISVELLWSASNSRDLTVSNLSVINPSFETYLLEPGKTYIINIGHMGDFTADIYHSAQQVKVRESGAYSWDYPELGEYSLKQSYPGITEYYEGFWDTDIGHYYRQSAEACYLNANSVTAITTGDLSAIPSWASGKVFLQAGRAFTQEDYEQGAKVCLVSQHFLDKMQLKIGDTIDLSFYETSYTLNRFIRNSYSAFDPYLYDSVEDVAIGNTGSYPLDHIFDKNTFTIVGVYGGNVAWRSEHDSELFNECMHWQMILLPETAVQNQPNVKLSPYMTTIRLEPLMIQKFLAAAQASGLMDEQPYGYQLGLTIDDHGLSNMIAGLESLQQVSRLTLMLASVTAALAVLVLAILHLLQNRKQIAILRSMGVRKGQVTTCVLAGVLLVCVLGAVLGAWCGEKLSENMVQTILANAQAETLDSSFSAMLATDDDAEDDFQLTAEADPKLTLLTASVISATMILVSTALVLRETRKPLLLMLGVKE